MNFSYAQPVRVIFGAGKIKDIETVLSDAGFSRGVLVCDRFFAENGEARRIAEYSKRIAAVFSDVTPNPTLEEVRAAVRVIRAEKADFVIALGGGSSMDLAKFAAATAFGEYDAADYFYRKQGLPDVRPPMIAVPTTAGTGSEVTAVSVLNDEQNGIKAPLSDGKLYAHTAIVDPELTLSVPPFVTAATGIDALAHALEAYWCKANNPVSDSLSLGAAAAVLGNLEKAYADGRDVTARSAMSYGALAAGLAFSQTRTAASHACSYPLSEDYGLCHGEAVAFTLDAFARVNGRAVPERMNALSRALGFCDYNALADEIVRLKRVTKLKGTLAEVGISDTLGLAEKCLAHPLMRNNPAELSVGELKAVFDGLV